MRWNVSKYSAEVVRAWPRKVHVRCVDGWPVVCNVGEEISLDLYTVDLQAEVLEKFFQGPRQPIEQLRLRMGVKIKSAKVGVGGVPWGVPLCEQIGGDGLQEVFFAVLANVEDDLHAALLRLS
jgi:hypothetical protein